MAAETEEFKCERTVIPMAQWIRQDPTDPSDCRKCVVAPVASMYAGTLEEAHRDDLRVKLEEAFNKADVLTICDELDNIKAQVGDASLRNQLVMIDCMGQSYKHDEDAEKQ